MKTPSYLKKGDKIGIVACARKVSQEELQPAIELFKSWGLEVVLSKNLFKEENQFAGSDNERAEDLQAMFDDHSINAVICARGGYGTLRIIDKIDFTKFKQHPKWMIGFSDVTVLHSHINTLGVATIHAKMLLNINKNPESTETLRKALFGEQLNYSVDSFPLNRKGTAETELVGGNLSLLYALSGSISDIDTKGKILFMEDLDEYLYHIDRMMFNLKRSGKLSHLSGLVVGGMTEMKDNAIPFGKTAEEIIMDAVKEFNYPVCFNFPAGHIDRNLALILGRNVKLEVSDKGSSLTFEM
jgi:muramoyltetrapeptide carboxypeptidase